MIAFAIVLALFSSVKADVRLTEIQHYLSSLHGLEERAPESSVEATFEAATTLRARLLKEEGDGTYLETLDEARFESLAGELRGIILNREEFVVAEPAPSFFLELARRYGGSADVEFFENYTATLPDGVWRSYVTQQTDISGCTEFGGGELTTRYGGWLRFRREHSKAYETEVAAELSAIEYEVSEGTCACGELSQVLAGLEEFNRTFPDSPAAERVRQRIREIKSSKSRIRTDCISG